MKLSPKQLRALSAIQREVTLSGGCLSGCFGVHSVTVSALVRRDLIVATVSNPTAEQRWRITDAGRRALRQEAPDAHR